MVSKGANNVLAQPAANPDANEFNNPSMTAFLLFPFSVTTTAPPPLLGSTTGCPSPRALVLFFVVERVHLLLRIDPIPDEGRMEVPVFLLLLLLVVDIVVVPPATLQAIIITVHMRTIISMMVLRDLAWLLRCVMVKVAN
jgi:hypothetical protein